MSESSGLFLALDQSTSATKALLFTPEGQLVDQEAVAHRQIYPRPGWVEHDPDEIYANTLAAVTTLLRRHTDRWSELRALSITNQRETFVVLSAIAGGPCITRLSGNARAGKRAAGRSRKPATSR